jgi:hypothetical protein
VHIGIRQGFLHGIDVIEMVVHKKFFLFCNFYFDGWADHLCRRVTCVFSRARSLRSVVFPVLYEVVKEHTGGRESCLMSPL